MIKLQNLKRMHESLKPKLLRAFDEMLDSSAFVGGESVKNFERELAQYCQSQHCIGVGNGTDALEITLEALGVGPGDFVVVPALTFASTAEAVVRVGASPVFADVAEGTVALSAATVSSALKNANVKPKALIFVHLHGEAKDLTELKSYCDGQNIAVVEDCAQVHGARRVVAHKTIHAGTVGVAGTFSFYPAKNLGALGDGGAVITNDSALAGRMKLIRDHGRIGKYEHKIIGRNSRLDAIQAEFLRIKLEVLDDWNNRRRQVAAEYAKRIDFSTGAISMPQDDHAHTYHQLVVRLTEGKRVRDAFRQYMTARGIETGVHYPIPLHQQLAFQPYTHGNVKLPVTERLCESIVSLPIDPFMTEHEVATVTTAVNEFLHTAPFLERL